MICPACRAEVPWVQFCPQCGLAHAFETRFTSMAVIARGTTATVYAAHDRETRRRVAVRLIHVWHASDRDVRARFHATRERLEHFAHEHAIRLLAAGEEQGPRLLVVTERADATTQLDQLTHEAMPWSRAADIVTQLCSVLSALHARGVVHGKLSPSKIYLAQRHIDGEDPYRSARVGDIARLDVGCCLAGAIGADASLRLDYTPILRYQSPEQLGGRVLDARSDVFALGVLAYELVTGRSPFPARPSYAQLVMRPEPPSRHVPVSPAVDALILRCLEVDREQRLANTDELRAAIASTA